MRLHRWASVAVLVALSLPVASAAGDDRVRSLDGNLNNLSHPDWGQAGTTYPRVAAANYADGRATPVSGPPVRYVSDRIFNDTAQNIFSENGVTQWGAAWGQFLDHTFGLRQETGGESAPLAFNAGDPLEAFHNDLGSMAFSRTPAAPGTGVTSPREQLNVVGGYIDASAVYGDSPARLQWLRDDAGHLLLPGGYLPRADAKGDVAAAPPMALFAGQVAHPGSAVEAGDVRANESMALTATQTLFAREHNRIVDALPDSLPAEERFQIARRVVGAEQQYITYNEFLPALGVGLPTYRGYDPQVDAAVSNEFAAVGFRAHSMVHGEIDLSEPVGTYTQAQLDGFAAQGVEVSGQDGRTELTVPLGVSFGNPELLQGVGLGPMLAGIGAESQYRNDEQIDNQLRSVLFQLPGATGVTDLAAIDIARARDHGMPSYNALRQAYGLAPKASFTAITGEATDRFPADPAIDPRDPIDDPHILDFTSLRNAAGEPITLGSPEAQTDAVSGTRRTTVAARLRAIYGTPDQLDAFVGMSSERHVGGTEFGELQLAMWAKQFAALRDGDRFFYAADPALADIQRLYGISYRQTLARIIERNTGERVQPEVFKAAQ
ncbi:MAG: peroxidase [Solirubrobacteraceae bacterium]|nr:peroxidase [Solirubrobacteraceae bacterium]